MEKKTAFRYAVRFGDNVSPHETLDGALCLAKLLAPYREAWPVAVLELPAGRQLLSSDQVQP